MQKLGRPEAAAQPWVQQPVHQVSGFRGTPIKVEIEDGVYVGTGARILPRLKIERNATIGAASLVNKSVLEGQRIIGAPGIPH